MEVSTLTLATVVITILLTIVGFFLTRLINDVKHCIVQTGKNRGKIDLIAKQQENDIKRIEDATQCELKALTKSFCILSDSVQKLVVMLAENGIKK
tara:strand:- start:14089 stop:14376 length:288 start_codon:yes stop_codon:yes gene_type:complete